MTTEPVVLTAQQAAKLCNLSPSFLLQKARSGAMPGVVIRVGRTVRFHRERLVAWIESFAEIA